MASTRKMPQKTIGDHEDCKNLFALYECDPRAFLHSLQAYSSADIVRKREQLQGLITNKVGQQGHWQNLLASLDELPRYQKQVQAKKTANATRQQEKQAVQQNRKETQKMIQDHPFGNLIASTQVINHRSPGGAPNWGTKRKRRP
jgi:hypothetical protein